MAYALPAGALRRFVSECAAEKDIPWVLMENEWKGVGFRVDSGPWAKDVGEYSSGLDSATSATLLRDVNETIKRKKEEAK